MSFTRIHLLSSQTTLGHFCYKIHLLLKYLVCRQDQTKSFIICTYSHTFTFAFTCIHFAFALHSHFAFRDQILRPVAFVQVIGRVKIENPLLRSTSDLSNLVLVLANLLKIQWSY